MTVREVRCGDAAALVAAISMSEVARFISPLQSLRREDAYLDQILWTITADRWQALRPTSKVKVH